MSKPIEKFDPEGKFKDLTYEDHEAAKARYIASYTEYEAGGFFSPGGHKNNPVLGEAKWNAMYPRGAEDWAVEHGKILSAYGQRLLIKKVDELIDRVNKLEQDVEDLERGQ